MLACKEGLASILIVQSVGGTNVDGLDSLRKSRQTLPDDGINYAYWVSEHLSVRPYGLDALVPFSNFINEFLCALYSPRTNRSHFVNDVMNVSAIKNDLSLQNQRPANVVQTYVFGSTNKSWINSVSERFV